MKKAIIFIAVLAFLACFQSYSQKKYGYTVIHLRCDQQDPYRDRIYFSPIIELNQLNFDRYTKGIDPTFPKYSVRYYNYAIAKWFEIFLEEQYGILVNDAEKYERNATCVVFDQKNNNDCNNEKTHPGCFFTEKQKLIAIRDNAIHDSKLPTHAHEICEVIAL